MSTHLSVHEHRVNNIIKMNSLTFILREINAFAFWQKCRWDDQYTLRSISSTDAHEADSIHLPAPRKLQMTPNLVRVKRPICCLLHTSVVYKFNKQRVKCYWVSFTVAKKPMLSPSEEPGSLLLAILPSVGWFCVKQTSFCVYLCVLTLTQLPRLRCLSSMQNVRMLRMAVCCRGQQQQQQWERQERCRVVILFLYNKIQKVYVENINNMFSNNSNTFSHVVPSSSSVKSGLPPLGERSLWWRELHPVQSVVVTSPHQVETSPVALRRGERDGNPQLMLPTHALQWQGKVNAFCVCARAYVRVRVCVWVCPWHLYKRLSRVSQPFN